MPLSLFPSAAAAGPVADAEPAPAPAARGVYRHPPATPEFVARVRERLAYDPETGVIRWRLDIWSGKHGKRLVARAGDIAGSVDKAAGYRRMLVGDRKYSAHRLAWLIVKGEWPADQLDHIDGNRLNNAFANLREADFQLNNENQRRASRSSTHGVLGVTPRGKRWEARIRVVGYLRYLGTYDSAEQAHRVYVEAKRRLHRGCTI